MVRPATPGTILVLAAAVLLVLVTVSTPIIKSISFLDATIGGSGNEGGKSASLGCLGYCIDNTCSDASIGYTFDPNQLLGIDIIPAKYTSTVIKGLTYALVLHPVALALAVASFIFGVMSHCRGCSVCCFDTIFASLGAFITLVAFGLDCALFIIAKKRIESVDGATASLGSALWMTLAAWLLMMVGSCAFSCGVCSRRKRNKVKDEYASGNSPPWKSGGDSYGERMRMQAMDAESERNFRQKEADLPKFAEYETEHVESVPLKTEYEDPHYNGTGAVANGAAGAGAYGRSRNNQGYAGYQDPYAPQQSVHTPYSEDGYSYGAYDGQQDPYGGVSAGYAPGVGPGMRRQHSYNNQPQWNEGENTAGFGAHASSLRSPTRIASPEQMPEGHMQNLSPYAVAGGAAAAGALGAGGTSRRQATQDSTYPYSHAGYGSQAPSQTGHNVDYSGATFGQGTHQASGSQMTTGQRGYGGAYSDVGHASSTDAPMAAGAHRSYSQSVQSRAPSRATNASRNGRGLPPVPMPEHRDFAYNADEIPYRSPTSDLSPTGAFPGREASMDDGFGLAVLQAGQAAKQVQDRPLPDPLHSSRGPSSQLNSQTPLRNEKGQLQDHYAAQDASRSGPNSRLARPLPSAPAPTSTGDALYNDQHRYQQDDEDAPAYHAVAEHDPAAGNSPYPKAM